MERRATSPGGENILGDGGGLSRIVDRGSISLKSRDGCP